MFRSPALSRAPQTFAGCPLYFTACGNALSHTATVTVSPGTVYDTSRRQFVYHPFASNQPLRPLHHFDHQGRCSVFPGPFLKPDARNQFHICYVHPRRRPHPSF